MSDQSNTIGPTEGEPREVARQRFVGQFLKERPVRLGLAESTHIPLRAQDGSVRAWAIVDATAPQWIFGVRWCLGNHGYAKRTTKNGVQLLHREILGLSPGDGLEGDHINRQRLDNRRDNLRVVSRAENRQNRSCDTGSSSHRGVSWHRGSQKWRAQVFVGGRNHYLGLFADEKRAAEVALAFRSEHLPFSVESP